ncbi:hypothetical protein Desor_3572 [Desulfosporosinus orientis DSM 765]|uniref:Cytochrome b/b6 C-terminal region profile domain-containing protein n=1 Tax=Desulfosporosinus orientis (strain ATCC 19365 / DSM 765 / NCIMB 8382 / VKM B-1628 / Singapore I) TaxID=768706 RepID=G7WIH9_DESOD|nr:hypothetical protein [Desulfosporosinus orientis]AET69053.1 hypothetical protein Desor_3572 [Desulfosporosinus orientis DSM 765]
MPRVSIKQLLEREKIAGIVFLAFCLALALFFPPSVGTSNQAPYVSHAVAPWIFGPFQVMLLYLPPWAGALLIPIILFAGIGGLPWIVRYLGVKWGQGIFAAIVSFVSFLLVCFIVKEFWWI